MDVQGKPNTTHQGFGGQSPLASHGHQRRQRWHGTITQCEVRDKVKSALTVAYLSWERDTADAGSEAAVEAKNRQSVHRLRIPDSHVRLHRNRSIRYQQTQFRKVQEKARWNFNASVNVDASADGNSSQSLKYFTLTSTPRPWKYNRFSSIAQILHAWPRSVLDLELLTFKQNLIRHYFVKIRQPVTEASR